MKIMNEAASQETTGEGKKKKKEKKAFKQLPLGIVVSRG